MPESCGVAMRIDSVAGSWLGVWRPAERRMLQLAGPEGWLAGSGLWSSDGVLRLPYTTGSVPCGVMNIEPFAGVPVDTPFYRAHDASYDHPMDAITQPAQADPAGQEPFGLLDTPGVCRPVPLQQAL